MLSPNVERILKQRYYKPGENWDMLVERVVQGVCKNESSQYKDKTRYFIGERIFLPNSLSSSGLCWSPPTPATRSSPNPFMSSSSQSGETMQSESVKAINSPRDSRTAILRARDGPPLDMRINRIALPYRPRTSGVPSVEPSSTTMISLFSHLRFKSESTHLPTTSMQLYAGMIIDI